MRSGDERGVTLLELLFAVAILVVVTSAAIAFVNSAYDSYSDNSIRSQNQRQATLLLKRLSQDIREAQPDEAAIQVEALDGSDEVTITKQPDPETAPITVKYVRQEDGSLAYLRDADQPDEGIVIVESGRLSVKAEDGAYKLRITVGDGEDGITLDTTVARYDWGR